MRIVVFFISFLYFSAQIAPLKCISYLCDYELCEDTDEDDCNDDFQMKNKLKNEKEVDLQITFFARNITLNQVGETNNYFIINIVIPDDYIRNILVPPPNC
jgi:hypothetical protein